MNALRLVQTTRFRVSEPKRIRGPRDVFDLLLPHVKRDTTEVFWGIPLDTQHNVIRGPIIISIGTLDTALIHPRELYRAAIVAGCSALIVAHNHPSGDPTPSFEDRDITTQLVSAGKIIGIPILDHVIVCRDRYVSFVEAGLLSLEP